MEKDFVPYELALALKEIGYQSSNPIGGYRGGAVFYYDKGSELFYDGLPMYSSSAHEGQIIAPLYSQAFRWFREKYDLIHFITPEGSINNRCYLYSIKDWKAFVGTFGQTYEEAEFECLKKLIQIVSEKVNGEKNK